MPLYRRFTAISGKKIGGYPSRHSSPFSAFTDHVLISAAYRRLEKTTKLACKVYGYARVNRALFVEETLRPFKCENTFMPDVWMNVEALPSIKTKADEFLRRDVVTRQCQRDIERTMVERKEKLSAVGVIVRMPK